MSVACSQILFTTNSLSVVESSSKSKEGEQLTGWVQLVSRHLMDSYVLGNPTHEIMAEIAEIKEETSKNGWDGYGAPALTLEAIEQAKRFARTFPSDLPTPDLSPAPDGEVHFEWSFGFRQVVSASISSEGEVTFASLNGAKRVYGAEPFEEGSFPDELLGVFRRF